MSRDTPEVISARIEAERARGRLMDTAKTLQARLSPSTLANNAWETAKAKGTEVADQTVETVKRRPGMAGGIAAAVTLFLARKPLKSLVTGARRRRHEADDDDDTRTHGDDE